MNAKKRAPYSGLYVESCQKAEKIDCQGTENTNELLKHTAQAGFSYDNSVSLQNDNAGHVSAAVLAHVACVVGLQTNHVRRN